tara:strand:+ start:3897 stop:4130 length:234 start_codon:yes stop_codon:yes gene_type:complete
MVVFDSIIHKESFQCISCFFYVGRIPGGLACYAFPEGIPSEIITGEYDHRNRHPGDAGITWREAENWARPIETEDEE